MALLLVLRHPYRQHLLASGHLPERREAGRVPQPAGRRVTLELPHAAHRAGRHRARRLLERAQDRGPVGVRDTGSHPCRYWQFASELLFELQLSNPTRGQLVPPVGTAPPGESVAMA